MLKLNNVNGQIRIVLKDIRCKIHKHPFEPNDKVIAIETYEGNVTKGKIYRVETACDGVIEILDDNNRLSFVMSGIFILATKSAKILYGGYK